MLWVALALITILFSSGCHQEDSAPQVIKIGIVNLTHTLDAMVGGFKKGMADLGYTEGENVVYFYEGAAESIPAAEPQILHILEKEPDLIISMTTPITKMVRDRLGSRRIPILFAPVNDPVKSGLVKSLREPGGQMTGVIVSISASKGLEWLMEVVPDLKRLYVPVNPEDQAMGVVVTRLKAAAKVRGVDLVLAEAVTPEEVRAVMTHIPPDVQAIWEMPSGFWAPYVSLFLEAQTEQKTVLMASNLIWSKMGAVMSVGSDLNTVGRQVSRMADKILKGTPPALLPVERTDLFLYLNQKSARLIDVDIPLKVLKQAEIIYR